MASEVMSNISRIRWKYALVYQHGFPKPIWTFGPNIGARQDTISFEFFPANVESFVHVAGVSRFDVPIEKRAVSSEVGGMLVIELCDDRCAIHEQL